MEPYRVLVVDDHPDTAEVLSVMFHMLGHKARCALRGRDAIELAREMDPDLILLDLGLPDIHGYEVVRALRAESQRPRRFIAAVTGHDLSDPATVLAGFDKHIIKPVDLGTVRLVLRSADSHYARGAAAITPAG